MPRTLLSTVTAEYPTAFIVRQEMRNWMMLQFEPTFLRKPNSIYDVKNAKIEANGSNIPATLYRLKSENTEADVYQKIANKLTELVEGVQELSVDRDDKRDLLTLYLGFKGGLRLPAQSLSDGTLRFLCLSALDDDRKASGLVCLEEPENGIHPEKINAMIRLLLNIAVDTSFKIGEDNPLRQVIINTHSPIVVKHVPSDSLLLANSKEVFSEVFHEKIRKTSFSALPNTWRTDKDDQDEVSLGAILNYLDGGAILFDESNLELLRKSRKINNVSDHVEQLEQLKISFND